jgi:hypothetical protein
MDYLEERDVSFVGFVVCEISSPLSLWAESVFASGRGDEVDSYGLRHVNSGTEMYLLLRVSLPSARFERGHRPLRLGSFQSRSFC